MIRLTIPSIEEDDLDAVRKVLESGYLVQGQQVSAFEKVVAEYVGTKYAIAVSNCTAALHLALLALDVRPGDLVVVTAYSFISTANVIELCGAEPVFVDINSDTFNIDPTRLEETLNRLMSNIEVARRVKAIIPVHTFGQMADMPAILKLAERYSLPVIEDAACALGATLNGRQAGSWGVIGCFSFHPRKAVTTGEGGMITTNDPMLACRLRTLRNHGQDSETKTPTFIMPGFNYRLTEFQGALGLTQMSKLDRIIQSRRSLAKEYDLLLYGTEVRPPYKVEGHRPVYQSYVTLLPEKTAPKRTGLIAGLRKDGIETNIGTWHIPMTTYYRNRYGFLKGDFPGTEDVFARSLTLPLYETLSYQELRKIVNKLLQII